MSTAISQFEPLNNKMKIHVLHHVRMSVKHGITHYLETSSHQVGHTYLSETTNFPAVSDIDWLIIMGGPISANDEHKYPWLTAEKQFIKRVIDNGKTVFGICLGAQLIAQTLGAKVTTNKHPEFSWHPVYPSKDIQDTFLADVFNHDLTLFHSHGETFDIPVGAKRIASSEACKNQGFIYDDRVVAIQFHPEITPELAELFNNECRTLWHMSPYYRDVNYTEDQPLFNQSSAIIKKLLHLIESNA